MKYGQVTLSSSFTSMLLLYVIASWQKDSPTFKKSKNLKSEWAFLFLEIVAWKWLIVKWLSLVQSPMSLPRTNIPTLSYLSRSTLLKYKVCYSRGLGKRRWANSHQVMSWARSNFSTKELHFERPRDVTWWEKLVFHGAPAFAQTPGIANLLFQ